MMLRPLPMKASIFTWNNDHGVAEASDIAAALGVRDFIPERVYDDACDVGFTLISDRTGREVVFYLARTHCDDEGDFKYWEFHSLQREGLVVTVFND